MNRKIETIEFRCKCCNKRIMDYIVQEDNNEIVLQGIMVKCERCKKVITFKKYTQKMIFDKAVANSIRI